MPANKTTVTGHFLRNFQMGCKSLGVDRENSSLEGVYTLGYVSDDPHSRPPSAPLNFFKGVKFWNHRFSPINEAQRTIVACRPHYNCLRDRLMPDIIYYFRSPRMPTLDSDHAECEGVSNGLRSLGFAQLYALHSNSIYFCIFLKNYCPYGFAIFSVASDIEGINM